MWCWENLRNMWNRFYPSITKKKEAASAVNFVLRSLLTWKAFPSTIIKNSETTCQSEILAFPKSSMKWPLPSSKTSQTNKILLKIPCTLNFRSSRRGVAESSTCFRIIKAESLQAVWFRNNLRKEGLGYMERVRLTVS